MVGREVQLTVDRGESHPAGTVLQRQRARRQATTAATRWSGGVDLEVRAGEIFGIAGVAGNGQDELVEAIIGLRRPTRGDGHPGRRRTSPAARPAADERGGGRLRAGRPPPVRADPVVPALRQPRPHELPPAAVRAGDPAQRRRRSSATRQRRSSVRHPDAVGRRQRGHALGRQPAEGRRGAGVRPRPQAAGPRPADARPGRRQHRVHPPPGDRQARRGDGGAARLGGARRGPGDVRPDRR